MKGEKRQATAVSQSGYVCLTLTFSKEGRRWVAHCEELGTATFGRSLPEVEEKLKEAVLLNLNALEIVGERERFFSEHNIKLHSSKPRTPIKVAVPLDSKVFVQSLCQRIPQRSVSPSKEYVTV